MSSKNHEVPHYAVFSSLLSLVPSEVLISSPGSFPNNSSLCSSHKVTSPVPNQVFFPQCDWPGSKLSVLPTLSSAQTQTKRFCHNITGPLPNHNKSTAIIIVKIKHIIWNLKKKVFCSYRYHIIANACVPTNFSQPTTPHNFQLIMPWPVLATSRHQVTKQGHC